MTETVRVGTQLRARLRKHVAEAEARVEWQYGVGAFRLFGVATLDFARAEQLDAGNLAAAGERAIDSGERTRVRMAVGARNFRTAPGARVGRFLREHGRGIENRHRADRL